MADEFVVEKAKSGRAECRKCRLKIEKDEIRIGHISENAANGYSSTKWFHAGCSFTPRRNKAIRDSGDLGGFHLLEPAEQVLALRARTLSMECAGGCIHTHAYVHRHCLASHFANPPISAAR
jgi:hypothetical protein